MAAETGYGEPMANQLFRTSVEELRTAYMSGKVSTRQLVASIISVLDQIVFSGRFYQQDAIIHLMYFFNAKTKPENRKIIRILNMQELVTNYNSQAMAIYERLINLKTGVLEPQTAEVVGNAVKQLNQAIATFSY